jgi:hypothetical protein
MSTAAFWKKLCGGNGLHVGKTDGGRADEDLTIRLPLSQAVKTDPLGKRLADAALLNVHLAVVAGAPFGL